MRREPTLHLLLRRTALALSVAIIALACTPKEEDYFLTSLQRTLTGNLRGTVTSSGTPISGATIALTGPSAGTITTGGTGIYAFNDLSLGPYTINTTAAGFNCPSAQATIVANQTTTLNINCTPTPGSVSGTVTVNGVGQPGIVVTVVTGDFTVVGTATTGADGTYTISNVPPGAGYGVSIQHPPEGTVCTPSLQIVTVQSGQTAAANFACNNLPGSVTGTVTVDGVPRDGITVTLVTGDFTQVGTATTGADGTYTISNVPPGGYRAVVQNPPEGTICTPDLQFVTVQPGQTATANFACNSISGSVTGTVTVDVGTPDNITVTLTQDDVTIGTATTDADGNYTIGGVPQGSSTVTITPPSGKVCTPSSQSVDVQAGQAATANFACTTPPPQVGSVTGIVRVDGVGGSGIVVTLTQGSTTFGTATTSADGTYTFADVPPGSYTASITPLSGVVCTPNPQTVAVQANQAATANFDCTTSSNQFVVDLTDPPPSYRHISAASSETCTGMATTPARPGGLWTTMWSGTGTVGTTQRSGSLDANGKAVDRQSINLFGLYTVTVTVTANGVTVTATGSVDVQAAPGSCPP